MILKFAQGMALPLVSYTPVVSTGPAVPSATPEKSSKEDDDISFKDIFGLLDKALGILPNDIDGIKKQLLNLIPLYGETLNNTTMATMYLHTLALMLKAVFHGNEYTKAYEKAIETGGLDELAVNSQGLLFGYNDKTGDVDFFSSNQLKLAKEKNYRLLTNLELLQLRKYRPDLAFNGNILSIVQNSTGMKEINTMLLDVIEKAGSEKRATSGIYDTRTQKGLLLLQSLVNLGLLDPSLDGLSLEGLYKNKVITESQAKQLKQALDYLVVTLPTNARTLLDVKAQNYGVKTYDLILSLLSSQTGDTINFETDYSKELNDAGGGGKIPMAMLLQNDLGAETLLPINAGTTDSLYITAYEVINQDLSGNNLLFVDLKTMALKSALSGILNYELATMGDKSLEATSLNNVIVNGNVYKAYLPYDLVAAAKGISRPNLEYLAKLELVRKKIRDRHLTTPREINAVYEEYGLPQFVDADGKVLQQYYRPFVVMLGTALEDAFKCDPDELQDNKYFEEIFDNKAANVFNQVRLDKDLNFDDQVVVKGLVYIPINLNPALAALSGQSSFNVAQMQGYTDLYNLNLRTKNVKLQGLL